MTSGLPSPSPMFPLGSVLFPHELAPLHVFEDRYRVMMREVLAGTSRFGVVLIERGSEVGGSDQRAAVGTMARVVEAAELHDGRWVLVARGEYVVRIDDWLLDDPYPRAHVSPIEEGNFAHNAAEFDDAERAVRRCLALARELGADVAPFDSAIDPDPARGLWQLAALAPLGPADRQRILAAPDGPSRRQWLLTLALDAAEAMALQLGQATELP